MVTPKRTSVDSMPGPRFIGGWVPHRDPRALYTVCRAGSELYFLNHGPDTLDCVRGSTGGSLSDEDGVLGHAKPVEIAYEQVKSGEAVLLDAFDDFTDSDWFYVVTIEVERKGQVERFGAAGRGGPDSEILKRR